MRNGGGWGSALSPRATAATRTVTSELAQAADRLRRAGCETPRLDAELLLGAVLGRDRAGLVIDAGRSLTPTELDGFDELVARRETREPVAYILGRRGFRALELDVDSRVLIPRPETEHLVEAALSLPDGWSVADVGTGSGAVALALALERPDLRVSGLDVSPDALQVARGNARRLGLDVRFAQADLLDGEPYDAVVANLPYVADGERAALGPEITNWEPALALFAGGDGLHVIRRLLAQLPDGVQFVGLEIGAAQGAAVLDLVRAARFAAVEIQRDLAGHDRVVVGRR